MTEPPEFVEVNNVEEDKAAEAHGAPDEQLTEVAGQDAMSEIHEENLEHETATNTHMAEGKQPNEQPKPTEVQPTKKDKKASAAAKEQKPKAETKSSKSPKKSATKGKQKQAEKSKASKPRLSDEDELNIDEDALLQQDMPVSVVEFYVYDVDGRESVVEPPILEIEHGPTKLKETSSSESSQPPAAVINRGSLVGANLPTNMEERINYEHDVHEPINEIIEIEINDDDKTETESTVRSTSSDHKPTEIIDRVESKNLMYVDFLEMINEVPSITAISEHSLTEQAAEWYDEIEGKFVNPLTGELLDIPEKTDEELVEELPVEEEDENDENNKNSEGYMRLELPQTDEDDELLVLLEDEEIEIKNNEMKGKAMADLGVDYAAMLMEIEKPKVVAVEDENILKLKLEQRRMIEKQTRAFLNDVINTVVNIAEFIDPKEILAFSLDATKLMDEVTYLARDFMLKKEEFIFQRDKTVEYFHRRKTYRSIRRHPFNIYLYERKMMKAALHNLDELLAQEAYIHKVTAENIKKLEKELEQSISDTEHENHKFEHMVKKTLLRDRADVLDKLPAIIDRQLQVVSAKRKELSQLRYFIIQRQHALANLIHQDRTNEDIGNGASLRDYMAIQTDILTLEKKIEDRIVDLEKMQRQCNANINILAHTKEKQQMLNKTMLTYKEKLAKLYEDKKEIREYIYSINLKRNNVFTDLKNLFNRGEIIDKPELCFDYDKTLNAVRAREGTVQGLRDRLAEMEKKLQYLEQEKTD